MYHFLLTWIICTIIIFTLYVLGSRSVGEDIIISDVILTLGLCILGPIGVVLIIALVTNSKIAGKFFNFVLYKAKRTDSSVVAGDSATPTS
jgi:hypothetical protein